MCWMWEEKGRGWGFLPSCDLSPWKDRADLSRWEIGRQFGGLVRHSIVMLSVSPYEPPTWGHPGKASWTPSLEQQRPSMEMGSWVIYRI
jgi:hypothetical protein